VKVQVSSRSPGLRSSYLPRLPIPPTAKQWHTCGFRPDHSRGAAGGLHSLPLERIQPNHLGSYKSSPPLSVISKKIPRPMNQPGDFPFLSSKLSCVHNLAHEVVIHHYGCGRSSGSPGSLASLPIPLDGTVTLIPVRGCAKEIASPIGVIGARITAAGPLPTLTGFPIKPLRAPLICVHI